MKYYLVTNSDNLTFPNVSIKPNVSYSEKNPNYAFNLYKDLNVAKFIQPTLEGIENPKFWSVEPTNIIRKHNIRDLFESCKVLKEEDSAIPSDEQYFNFAALVCMNYIKNKVFTEWILNYLSRKDTSEYTANVMLEKMRLQSMMNIPLEETYLSPTYALINAVFTNNIKTYASRSAYKLICDAPSDLNTTIFASAAINNTTEQIYQLIKESL